MNYRLTAILLGLLCLGLGQLNYGAGVPRVNLQPAIAAGTPLSSLIFGHSRGNLPAISCPCTEFYPLWGSVAAGSTTEANVLEVMTTPGTLTDLRIELSGDIGPNADDATFTVMLDGSPTALACSIEGSGGGQTICEDNCDATPDCNETISVSVGQTTSLRVETLNTPAGRPGWSVHFTSDNNDEQNLLGHYPSSQATATRSGSIAGQAPFTIANTLLVGHLIPISGTIKNLRVIANTAPVATSDRIFTVQINGSNTDPLIQCTISDAETSCEDLVDSDDISAGDYISLEDNPNGTPGPVAMEIAVGLTFVTGTADKFLFGQTTDNATRNDVAEYSATAQNSTWNTNEGNRENGVQQAFTVTDMDVNLQTAPDTVADGKEWTITLRIDQGDTSPIVECKVEDTATTCTTPFSGATTIADNTEIAIQIDPSGTTPNNTSGIQIGFAGTVP